MKFYKVESHGDIQYINIEHIVGIAKTNSEHECQILLSIGGPIRSPMSVEQTRKDLENVARGSRDGNF